MTATATSALSVLLVEDEIIRMMVVEMLEELGHRVAAPKPARSIRRSDWRRTPSSTSPFSMSTSRAS